MSVLNPQVVSVFIFRAGEFTQSLGSEHFHLIGLGMVMLSPPVVSLPVKLLLFVMVDGWALVCGGVATSFR